MDEFINLRKSCLVCGGSDGRIVERNTQDTVWCVGCGSFQYNAPRRETGKPVRHVRTRENMSASLRARVFLRDGDRCVICGADGAATFLQVGHLLSVSDAKKQGLTEEDATVEENLAAMCDACNLGIGDETVPLRLVYRIFKARTRKDS